MVLSACRVARAAHARSLIFDLDTTIQSLCERLDATTLKRSN
jgi:hypothetical protein